MTKKVKNAAEALMRCLENEGIKYIFGHPGGAAIPIFDALYDSTIELILTRHEQGATHMADGYARASGKIGVALVTSGPGATNTITGLLTAQMDSVPLLVLAGQTNNSNNLGETGTLSQLPLTQQMGLSELWSPPDQGRLKLYLPARLLAMLLNLDTL